MAVYKVLQDVEAEDKLIGFLTFKGLIYAMIAGTSAFIEIRTLISSSLGAGKWVIMLIFLPIMLLFGLLASPLGRDQPTEVWLLSHLKFFFKPHKRIWDQSGINNLVTITAPKRREGPVTKNLSQTEVKSRLTALASTLDSRGWAVKNTDIDAGGAGTYLSGGATDDRLIATTTLPQDVPIIDIHAADDIMDEHNNPTAQKFAAMMQQADDKRRQDVLARVNSARTASDTTFLDSSTTAGANTTFVGSQVVAPGTETDDKTTAMTAEEQAVLERKHREDAEIESKMPKNFQVHSGLLTPDKRQATPAPAPAPKTPAPQVTPEAQAAKLELAQSGNDLSVASIASLANRKNIVQQIGPNEFEIDLH